MIRQRFRIKDLGEVSQYLGMQVSRDMDAGWLELSLERYTRRLADRFGDLLERTSRVQTPMAPDVVKKIRKERDSWSSEEAATVPRTRYLQLIGSLLYAATAAQLFLLLLPPLPVVHCCNTPIPEELLRKKV